MVGTTWKSCEKSISKDRKNGKGSIGSERKGNECDVAVEQLTQILKVEDTRNKQEPIKGIRRQSIESADWFLLAENDKVLEEKMS